MPNFVQITDSVTLNDSTTAASAKAVKTTYDETKNKLPLTGGTLTGPLDIKNVLTLHTVGDEGGEIHFESFNDVTKVLDVRYNEFRFFNAGDEDVKGSFNPATGIWRGRYQGIERIGINVANANDALEAGWYQSLTANTDTNFYDVHHPLFVVPRLEHGTGQFQCIHGKLVYRELWNAAWSEWKVLVDVTDSVAYSETGYIHLTNNVVMQWGTFHTSVNGSTVTFHHPFSTKPLVFVTSYQSGQPITVTNITTTSAKIDTCLYGESICNGQIWTCWLALGTV